MNKRNIDIPKKQLADFCRRWFISEFALFGSVLRDDFDPNSDLDVLVTFAPEAEWSLFDHLRMEQELAGLPGRKIDLFNKRAVEQDQAGWEHLLINNDYMVETEQGKVMATVAGCVLFQRQPSGSAVNEAQRNA